MAFFLKPGGALYLAEGHPAALVLDDLAPRTGPMPGWFVPYFHRDGLIFDSETDYADPDARLTNTRTCEWIHPIGEVVTGLIAAGLELRWLHEHDRVPWRMFEHLVEDADGMYRLARRALAAAGVLAARAAAGLSGELSRLAGGAARSGCARPRP